MADCAVKLKIKQTGEEIQLDDSKEVSEFLAKNKNRIKNNHFDLIKVGETKEETKLIESSVRFSEIIKNVVVDTQTKTMINPITGEYVTEGKGKDIHVAQAIDSGRTKDGNVLVTPFDKDDLRLHYMAKFEAEGYTKKESEQKVTEIFNKHKQIGDKAILSKSIAVSYFKNADKFTNTKSTADWWVTNKLKHKKGTPEYEQSIIVINDYIKQLSDFHKSLKERHGENSIMFAGSLIKAETITNNNIFGNMDLLVFDDKGIPHLYLFKNSSRPDPEWELAVNKRFDFELGFYRQMLAKHGFDVSQMGLNIVPIMLKDGNDTFETLDAIELKIPLNRHTNNSIDGPNRMTWEEGEIFNKVNQIMEVSLTETYEPISDEVYNILADMVPNDQLERIRSSVDVNSLIKYKVKKSYETENVYYFYDDLVNDDVYIESTAETAAESVEVRNAIEDYVTRKKNYHSINIRTLISELGDVMNGRLQLEDITLLQNNQGKENVVNNIKKYSIESGWSIFDAPNLTELGIIVLKNDISKQVDFITLSYLSFLNSTIKSLGLNGESYRTTLLGMHLKDQEVDFNVLPATNGNIELIKTMVAINQNIEMFQGNGSQYKIGEIKVLNPRPVEAKGNAATVADRSQLLRTFNTLMRLSGHESSNKISDTMFTDDITILINQINNVLTNDSSNLSEYQKKGIISLKDIIEAELGGRRRSRLSGDDVEKIVKRVTDDADNNLIEQDALGNEYNAMKIDAKIEFLESLIARFETKFNTKKSRDQDLINQSLFKGPVGEIYSKLNALLLDAHGIEFHQTKNVGKFMTNGMPLTGTMISQPEHVPEKNFRNIVELVKAASTATVRQSYDYSTKIINEIIKPYWQKSGFSMTQNKLLGFQSSLYENLYVRDSDGSINKEMLFKNPYDTSSADYKSMSEAEIELLKKALWEINRFRFNLKTEDSEATRRAKATEKWFWIPLAKSSNKLEQMGLRAYVSEKGDDFKRFVGSLKDTSSDKYQSEYISSSDDIIRSQELNRFEYSEISKDKRESVLKNKPKSYWELNLESLMLNYAVANIKKNQINRVMPAIRAIKMMSLFYGQMTDVDQTNLNDVIDKFVKSVVHSKNIHSQEERAITKNIHKIKTFASRMMIGGNLSAIPRDFFSGTWKAISLANSKMFLGKEQFGYGSLVKALNFVLFDAGRTIAGTSLIEALNLKMGLSDIDLNNIHHKLKSNKSGLANLSGKLFWTSTVGDYAVRLITFVAKAMHDGSWESFGINDYGLQYDWKADKRFEVYHKGDKSHADYHKQRSLYLSMLNEFNQQMRREGSKETPLKEGDALPFAYTDKEVISFKSFADMSYGFYSQDVRALHEKLAISGLFFQFKTYLTTHFVAYFLKPDHYNQYEKAFKFDPETGKQLYYKTNEFGEVVYDKDNRLIETTEVTDIPVTHLQKRWLQGIVYTVGDILKDLKTGGETGSRKDVLKSLSTDPTRRSALVKMGTDISILTVLGTLGAWLSELIKDRMDAETLGKDPTLGSVTNRFLYETLSRGYLKSFDDLSYKSITSSLFNTEPATLGYINNVLGSTAKVLTGNMSFENYIYRTNSIARTIRPIFKEALRVPDIEKELKAKKKERSRPTGSIFGFTSMH